MKSILVNADMEGLDTADALISEILDGGDCDKRCRRQIMMAVEEIFLNICDYAYRDKTGTVEVAVSLYGQDNDKIEISFRDTGIPFDPLEKEDPDVHEEGRKRKPGGLGIFLVKKTMDETDYRYDGGNIFTMRHHIKSDA